MEILIRLSLLLSFMSVYFVSFSIFLNLNNPKFNIKEKSLGKFFKIKNNNAFKVIPILIAFAVSVYISNFISEIIFE